MLARPGRVDNAHLHAVEGDFETGGFDLAAFGRIAEEDRIGVVDVQQDAPRGKPGQSRQRAVWAADRDVPHARASFLPQARRDHFIIGKQRAVEEQDVGIA